jgi:phage tail sheath protein FI
MLALPSHYREDDAITHAEILRPPTDGSSIGLPVPIQIGKPVVQPLSPGEERATSYGAIYHPWLITRRDNLLEPWQLVPPDGAACGVMAQRAIARGAWSAPANELLRGVFSLEPSLAAGRRSELQDAQVNIFRHEPRGFLSLSADTLSRDIDFRPINVRRLLILLRRLALRLGETYVFEPNDDSFRRLVQRGFEAALDQMFVRGAFAGRTAATSYQVITDDSINTPSSVDQGRFIVELRVAPSLPLTFITVRLIQTNDHSSVTEVR